MPIREGGMDLVLLDLLMAYEIEDMYRIGEYSCIPEPGCNLECC